MATSNFARGNTSKVYAVLMEYEQFILDEDGNETEETECISPESWEYDEFKEYIRETAQTKSKDTKYNYYEVDKSGNERQYNSTDLFYLSTSKMYGDIEVYLRITGQIVSGYYEGASLDYEIEVGETELSNGYYSTTIDDALDNIFEPSYDSYTSDMNKGMRKIQMNNAVKWVETELEKMKDIVESIFTEVSTPLNVVGTFSNGETIYEKSL